MSANFVAHSETVVVKNVGPVERGWVENVILREKLPCKTHDEAIKLASDLNNSKFSAVWWGEFWGVEKL